MLPKNPRAPRSASFLRNERRWLVTMPFWIPTCHPLNLVCLSSTQKHHCLKYAHQNSFFPVRIVWLTKAKPPKLWGREECTLAACHLENLPRPSSQAEPSDLSLQLSILEFLHPACHVSGTLLEAGMVTRSLGSFSVVTMPFCLYDPSVDRILEWLP